MNLLWGGMLLIGILYGAFNGRMQEITDTVLSASREAVTLCVTMTGILAFWQGLMEIAKDAGLTEVLCGKIRPLVCFLFPEIPADHPAYESISMNFIANFLGLGMAATPAGLKAMKDLENLEEKRRIGRIASTKPASPGMASREMCTFLIMNISSLQLIPVTMIAYRSQYGSVNPAAITGPAILATAASTGVAVIFCMVMNKKKEQDIVGAKRGNSQVMHKYNVQTSKK